MKKSVKTNAKVARQLYLMTRERLFGERPWRADKRTVAALVRQFIKMGLYQRVPGTVGDLRRTDLGKKLRADLMLVFMGAWDLFEVPEILDMHDLMSRRRRSNSATSSRMASSSLPWCYPTYNKLSASISRRVAINAFVSSPTARAARRTDSSRRTPAEQH